MNAEKPPVTHNVDHEEIAKFEAVASRWWDLEGEFKPLHRINPLRLGYIAERSGGLFGKKVLDVGCGSGILSIVALRLGASAVVGTDLDPDCMTSTHENMEVNHLDPSLGTFYVGNLIDDAALQEKVGTEEYDIVVANILADVIIPMAPVIPARLKRGGYFITSGIIDFKENAVKEAIEAAGLTVVEINHQGEWVNITARKPE